VAASQANPSWAAEEHIHRREKYLFRLQHGVQHTQSVPFDVGNTLWNATIELGGSS